MHTHSLDEFRHQHDHSLATAPHQARTRWVVAITAGMMVGELVIGSLTNSMALTADGWHIATHAGALTMSADLHLWEMAPGQHGCIVSLVTATPRDTTLHRKAIMGSSAVAHLTVEVRRFPT